MNIVEVCGYYPPHIGGIEYVAKNLAQELVAKGHDVTVFTSTIGSHKAGSVATGRLNEVYLRGFESAHTTFMPSLPFRLFRVEKSSVIHLHLSHVYTEVTVMLVAKMRGLPYVAHYHMDVDSSGPFGFLYKAYKKTILPFVVRGARKVIALSEEQRAILVERYKANPANVVVIPNGVGAQFFNDTKRDFVHKPLRLLFVGRFAKQKNLPRLLKAVSLLQVPVEVHLVGGGEQQSELELLVHKLDLKNVFFDGPKNGQAMIDAYKNADIFVLTSDREGMPLVLLEAAASGLSIVASNVQGLREFIKDNGLLVSDPSPETFATALNELMCDSNELKRLSEASTKWAARHTWTILAKRVEEVLHDAL